MLYEVITFMVQTGVSLRSFILNVVQVTCFPVQTDLTGRTDGFFGIAMANADDKGQRIKRREDTAWSTGHSYRGQRQESAEVRLIV